MKSETLSLKTILNKLDFLRETVIIPWQKNKKDLLLLATKLTEEIPDPCNTNEIIKSFIRKKNTKSVKQ